MQRSLNGSGDDDGVNRAKHRACQHHQHALAELYDYNEGTSRAKVVVGHRYHFEHGREQPEHYCDAKQGNMRHQLVALEDQRDPSGIRGEHQSYQRAHSRIEDQNVQCDLRFLVGITRKEVKHAQVDRKADEPQNGLHDLKDLFVQAEFKLIQRAQRRALG